MIGRFLATFGWLAWQAGRPFEALGGRRVANAAVVVVAVLLLLVAAVPIIAPLLDPQPEDATVQQIIDGTTEHPDGWLRLDGRLVPLRDSPTGEAGEYALLVDAADPLRAIVVESTDRLEAADSVKVTGTLVPAFTQVAEELPVEATVAGTPPRIHQHAMLRLDPVAVPERSVPWWFAIPPALVALALLGGVRSGYPVFRETNEIDVLAKPLAPGERVPSAFGGRIGTNERPLTDPGGALLLVRPGPKGSLLTAQPLADDGGVAPQPVLIGGSWTSGKVGALHTITETVPALVIRSELVDATFLFARNTERDRVAALVAVER